jgi:3-phosphoshikimate 1-carboxyvinyltransferase
MTATLLPERLLVEPVAQPLRGRVRLPGSKSYTNRVLPLAALATGHSHIEHALASDDTRYMAQALRDLGIPVDEHPAQARFVVSGQAGRIPQGVARLFIGNSGTTARFLTPLVALGSGEYHIDGSTAMQKRPIQPLLDALNAMGVAATSIYNSGCPPLRIHSTGWQGGHYTMRGDLSSQYFSGLLMSAAVTPQGLTLEVDGDLVSKPYIDLTKQAMNAFGGDFSHEHYQVFRVTGRQSYQATRYLVEPDASAASYFFAAAAVTGGSITVEGLGSDSLQGDLKFVGLLAQMGCRVEQTATTTTVTGPDWAAGEGLSGIAVDMRDISDTAQTLAAIAPFASGVVSITGIGFIRGKETDRVAAMVQELQRGGIRAHEDPDGLTIYPGQPQPCEVETYDDHRMAMSFALWGRYCQPGLYCQDLPRLFRGARQPAPMTQSPHSC